MAIAPATLAGLVLKRCGCSGAGWMGFWLLPVFSFMRGF